LSDNRIGNDLVGKINKEHRNLSKDALNDTGYDLINISFKYGQSEIRLMATLTGLTDTPTANWNDVKAIGSPYKFYFYDTFEREVSFKCQLYATNEAELATLWKKVNSLLKLTKPAGFGTSRGTIGKLLSLKIGNIINISAGFLTNCTMTVPDNSPWEIKPNSQAPFMCELDFSFKAVTLGGELYTDIATPGYQYSKLEKEGKLPIPSNTSNRINIPPNGEPDIIKLPNTNLTEPQSAGGMLGVSNPFTVVNDSATSNPFSVPNQSATSNPFGVTTQTAPTFVPPQLDKTPMLESKPLPPLQESITLQQSRAINQANFLTGGTYNPTTGEASNPAAKALFEKNQKIKAASLLKFGQ
jgi:hypothetical protein